MTAISFLLDKNVFLATNEQELCDFVRNHTVILPETLFYECYTSDELCDKKLLKRLYQLLKSGAYVTYQLMQIIADEGKNLSSCTCIIDYFETNNLRARGFREERTIEKAKIDEKKKDRSKMALAIKKLASKASTVLTPNQLKEIRRLNMGIKERFHKWIEMADRNDIHNLAFESYRKYVADPKKFCLSTEWLSWHNMRLMYAFAFEYSYLEITGSCPNDDKAENDCMDIEYIAFLSKSDGLLTSDTKLRDLAEAALPNKKVYSNIQDISG